MIYIVSLIYAPPRIYNRSMRELYESELWEYATIRWPEPVAAIQNLISLDDAASFKKKSISRSMHVILDQHYPLNSRRIRQADFPQATILDAGRNLGLHEGYNYVFDQIKPNPEDIIIGYSGDSLPPVSYTRDIFRALELPDVVWATCTVDQNLRELDERGYGRVAEGVWLAKAPCTNTVCAWRYGWLESVGGLSEPCKYYGHLESHMWAKLKQTGERWAFLPRCRLKQDPSFPDHDELYTLWKYHHAHKRDFDGDFKEFLQERLT